MNVFTHCSFIYPYKFLFYQLAEYSLNIICLCFVSIPCASANPMFQSNRSELLFGKYVKFLPFNHIVLPFLTYTLNWTVQSQRLYYADYCTIEDFKYAETIIIDKNALTRSIVNCRYDKIFREIK